MQFLSTIVPGQLVEARAHAWTVERVTHAPPCSAVDLAGADPPVTGTRLTLVVPFDDVRPLAVPAPRQSSPAAAFRRIRQLVADALPWPVPAVARDAHLDLHAHQLTAGLVLRSGRARRVLLADAVGTGKTVQAGLAVAQMVADAPGTRALVAVPPSLKAQWQEELTLRFGIDARVVDGVAPDAAGLDVPSPWRGTGVTITSFDYVKRVDVLGGLAGAWWDLLVVDEAHHAAGASDRAAALRALAARAARVLLVTATPHDGDARRFAALCAIGEAGANDPLLILSREPRGAVTGRRRPHRRRLAPSPEEAHAVSLLERYLDALAHAAPVTPGAPLPLLASVLRKRAASSPAALARTALRRRELLAAPPPAQQIRFDFADDGAQGDGEDEDAGDAWLGVRIAADPRHERAWLGAIAEAALRARAASRKLAALRRLIARVAEPLIVFTEYRDTLAWLHASLGPGLACEVLHGGQSAPERQAAIGAFTKGRARLLLATDAAAEGLNLHARCRAVVLFDLPWTPARVEQRIGRVDRIGQPRRVHAWMFDTVSPWAASLASRLEDRTAAVATWRPGSPDVDGRGTRAHDGGNDGFGEHAACEHLVRARAWLRSLHRYRRPDRGPGPRPTIAGVSARRMAALSARPREGLVLVQAVYSHGGLSVLERALFAARVPLPVAAHRAPERLPPGAAAVCDAALQAAAVAIEARRLALREGRRVVTRLEGAACAAVAGAVRASITAHFAQPGLFDTSPQMPVAATRHDIPAPAPAGDVSVLVTTPVVLLPRGGR